MGREKYIYFFIMSIFEFGVSIGQPGRDIQNSGHSS